MTETNTSTPVVTFEGSPFRLHQPFPPAGDQPEAIRLLVEGVGDGLSFQTLLGVTGYWDGMVSAQGASPYKSSPSELINNHSIYLDSSVYQKLNSKSYYSVYPPILQWVFSLCYVLSFKSVYIFSVIWKLILLLADAGSIYLLKKLQFSSKMIYWFVFNPLIMYEVFANGHPEGLLLFFLIGLIWTLKENKINLSFISLSLASGIKIFPIVFFPLLVKKMRFGQAIKYSALAAFFLLVFFLPIYPYFDHFLESIRKIGGSLGGMLNDERS